MKPLSKLDRRILLYLFVWLITTILTVVRTIHQSQNMIADDPSALAWLYFLPYLLPIFMAQALIFTVPLIAVGETALFLYKYIK